MWCDSTAADDADDDDDGAGAGFVMLFRYSRSMSRRDSNRTSILFSRLIISMLFSRWNISCVIFCSSNHAADVFWSADVVPLCRLIDLSPMICDGGREGLVVCFGGFSWPVGPDVLLRGRRSDRRWSPLLARRISGMADMRLVGSCRGVMRISKCPDFRFSRFCWLSRYPEGEENKDWFHNFFFKSIWWFQVGTDSIEWFFYILPIRKAFVSQSQVINQAKIFNEILLYRSPIYPHFNNFNNQIRLTSDMLFDFQKPYFEPTWCFFINNSIFDEAHTYLREKK